MRLTARPLPLAVVALVVGCCAPPAAAQTATPNQGSITLTGGIDVVNTFMFRGFLQDDTRVIMWPYAEASVTLHTATEGIRSIAVNVGTWNSLNTGLAGSAGPTGKLWYESDFYTTLALGLPHGIGVGTTFTAYTSPNNTFSTIKEIGFRVTIDNSSLFGGVPVKPYALVAMEFDTSPGEGQGDGGLNAGTYLEIGAAPAWAGPDLSISFPVRVGLSLHDYYELDGDDQPFGFVSIGALATLPLADSARYGAWNLRGGVEFDALGNTTEAFNDGDPSKFIAGIGIAFSY